MSRMELYRSPSEKEVDRVIESIIQDSGDPPEGVLLRKESGIKEICLVVDAYNNKNTEAMCYLASCLESIENGKKVCPFAHSQSEFKSQNRAKLGKGLWDKGKEFLKALL